jgi:hypothetical protein
MREAGTRPQLRLIEGDLDQLEYAWFCGNCAAIPAATSPPMPFARVCPSCSMGVLLEARVDAVPQPGAPFVVVDGQLLVQAVSSQAESFLRVAEEHVVNRPVTELLVPADAEAQGSASLSALITRAVSDHSVPTTVFVRPPATFGVRLRARISPCGPPRAALLVLDAPRSPRLRAV